MAHSKLCRGNNSILYTPGLAASSQAINCTEQKACGLDYRLGWLPETIFYSWDWELHSS